MCVVGKDCESSGDGGRGSTGMGWEGRIKGRVADPKSVVWRAYSARVAIKTQKSTECPAQAHACILQGGAGLKEPGEESQGD